MSENTSKIKVLKDTRETSGLVIGPDVVKEEEGRAALGAHSKKSTSLKKRTSLDAEKPPKPGSVRYAEAEASTVAESPARSTVPTSRISRSVSYTSVCKHTTMILYIMMISAIVKLNCLLFNAGA